jgi:uncharacterized protein YbbK (DUF523 family)
LIKEKLLISSCLVGENVRYDGSNNCIEELEKLKQYFELHYICPEVQSGMSIPRNPCEITSAKPLMIQDKVGIDQTIYFEKGAIIALEICKINQIKLALLKAKSPSCGNKEIYDGTFTNTLINGMGITTKYLQENGIVVFNEYQIKDLYEYSSK